MITLEANVHASQCNTCNGRDDVLAARFRAPGSSGSVIVALCRTCRAEAVGVLATLPPDPAPTTREPCGAWEDYGSSSRLTIPHGPTVRVYRLSADLTWRWYLDGTKGLPKNDPAYATKQAAQLAAEDAADALLLAGRRALGRIR